MWWYLIELLGVILAVWFSYELGFNKGVFRATYFPNSKDVKGILDQDDTFWQHY